MKGVAWTAPVAVLAVPTPAYAASNVTVALTGAIAPTGWDILTFRNNGPYPLPAGTLITWTVQNRGNNGRTWTIYNLNGVTLQSITGGTVSGSSTVVGGQPATATFTFRLTNTLASGAAVSWQFESVGGANPYNYFSRATVSNSGSVTVTNQPCVSDLNDVFGTSCPA